MATQTGCIDLKIAKQSHDDAVESANDNLNDFKSEVLLSEEALEELINKTSEDLSAIAEDFNLQMGNYNAFVRFNWENVGNPIMILGSEASPFKMNLSNEMIQFVYDGTVIAYMSGAAMHVQQQISFGDFIMYQRANGHLTIKKI